MNILLWVIAVFNGLLWGGFALVSFREGEIRAAGIAGLLAGLGTVFLTWSGFQSASFQSLILLTVVGAGALALVLFHLPIGRVAHLRDVPSGRFDEREIMFARARLQPGSENFHAYYALHPADEAKDNLFRALPGLLSPQAKKADPLLFACPEASFALTETMHTLVEGEAAPRKVTLLPAPELTQFVKALAKYYGALDVGITRLKPEHVYSHIGRGSGVYGAPLEVEHKNAIAFTVEMDYRMMRCAPDAPVVLESARQYVEAGRVAVQLAEVIRNWGVPARAHIDGDYRVICPLVARDAGLGEIGRMGLLMTPRQGPRVRIAVVTTDLELLPDLSESNPGMIDFCTFCGKCAQNCPVKAIPEDNRREIDGALRWKIDPDLCFRYWNAVGTDCGRCMRVCPYSHPDTFYHNLIRWGNTRSGLFRRAALRLDDLFYGKKPAKEEPPRWISGA